MDTIPGAPDFNNTQKAFAYKNDHELNKAHWLFQLMRFRWIVKLGTFVTPILIKYKFPVKGIIKNTIFRQFVGGITLSETSSVINELNHYCVDVILDYGVEGGEYDELKYEREANEFINVIQFAGGKSNAPFISIKVTGLTSSKLLAKLNISNPGNGKFPEDVWGKISLLDQDEKSQWDNLLRRVDKICAIAVNQKIGVMIDAEESWIQDPIDLVAELMMKKYNHNHYVVFNTIQLYRKDRFSFMKKSIKKAINESYKPAFKLVRGAYMEKERKRALEFGYTSPIHESKDATDKDYNDAIDFCFSLLSEICIIIASHNEQSTQLATAYNSQMKNNRVNIHFSQLYGMSDNLTFNLSANGYQVSKYLPFGPVEEVIPYLMRRAQENSSVSGQTTRELYLIKKELTRRQKHNI
jgi:proline dehydrogenase